MSHIRDEPVQLLNLCESLQHKHLNNPPLQSKGVYVLMEAHGCAQKCPVTAAPCKLQRLKSGEMRVRYQRTTGAGSQEGSCRN